MELVMAIGGTEVSVAWEDNESVDAIRDLADSGGIEINMSMYGGFEQVGSIGQSIPRNDEQTTTKAGDFSAGRYLKKSIDTVSMIRYTNHTDTMSTRGTQGCERGKNMIKGTPELITQRREEIINACEQLYQTKSFREITLKEIGNVTSFSRPTIYNYFETKEEIFLALFEREYDRWNGALLEILDNNERLGKEELAAKIAGSLSERVQLLKLLSMNNYDMEANSRQELLTPFKRAYGASMKNVCRLLEKFCPEMSVHEIQNFIYMFFPFMFGIYPYTAVTDKQRVAMKDADVDYVYQSVYELTYSCLCRLLGAETK